MLIFRGVNLRTIKARINIYGADPTPFSMSQTKMFDDNPPGILGRYPGKGGSWSGGNPDGFKGILVLEWFNYDI